MSSFLAYEVLYDQPPIISLVSSPTAVLSLVSSRHSGLLNTPQLCQALFHLMTFAIWGFPWQDWKRSVFIPIPKKGNAKECSNYRKIALISHATKVMLKILQARLQQYVNHELPDVQAGFRKGRGTRDQIANIRWITEKARVSEKHLFLLYWLCQSLWLYGSQWTVENSERDGNTRPPDLPLEKFVCRSGSNS